MDTQLLHAFILCLFLSFLSLGSPMHGQVKFEKEVRISEKKVPVKALESFQNSPFTGKIKWYKETSNDGISYEAKTIKQKLHFSIEFDTLGILQDIEVKTPFSNISDEGRKTIKNHLNDEFNKWKIIKTQFQLTGIGNELVTKFFDDNFKDRLILNYEIVLEGKLKGQYKLYEYLFSENGTLIRKSEIIPHKTDHFDF